MRHNTQSGGLLVALLLASAAFAVLAGIGAWSVGESIYHLVRPL